MTAGLSQTQSMDTGYRHATLRVMRLRSKTNGPAIHLPLPPPAPVVSNPTTSSLDLNPSSGPNPANTELAIFCTTTNNWVNTDGTLTTSPVWQYDANWGTTPVHPLDSNTPYEFKVKARNHDGFVTEFGPGATDTTSEEPVPDAEITAGSADPDPVQAGQATDLNATIENTGKVPHCFGVRCEVKERGTLIGQEGVTTPLIDVGTPCGVEIEFSVPQDCLSGEYDVVWTVWSGEPGSSELLDTNTMTFTVSYCAPTTYSSWGDNSMPYGLPDDLANEIYDGKRRWEPEYRYYYCRRGVLQDNDLVADNILDLWFESDAEMGFSCLTPTPREVELFLMRCPKYSIDDPNDARPLLGNPAYPEKCFPAGGEYIYWSSPNLNGTKVWNSDNLELEAVQKDWNYHLFRRLHPKSSLTDALTGEVIGEAPQKIVILIHGWNPNSDENPFENGAGEEGEWQDLRDGVKSWLQEHGNGEWALVEFNWAADADTGPVFWDANPAKGIDTWPTQNGTEAAEVAHLHGQALGELLGQVDDLSKVQFIAHSAGSWCARTAARYLLLHSAADVQVTFLDPYMPREGDADSALGAEILGRLDTDYGRQPVKLENYFSKYDEAIGGTVFFNPGTAQEFDWASVPSVQRQLDYSPDEVAVYGTYTRHGGPIAYYAATLSGTVDQESFWGDWVGADLRLARESPVQRVESKAQRLCDSPGLLRVGTGQQHGNLPDLADGKYDSESASVLPDERLGHEWDRLQHD